MAIAIEEFINPRSMVTPSLAAAIVATVSGALFSMLKFGLPWGLSLLSLFVGCVVFFSKEFTEGKMGILEKAFFYVLNALILFAMATAIHTMIDSKHQDSKHQDSKHQDGKHQDGKHQSETVLSIIGSAYAQDSQQTPPSLKQKRPIFNNWIQFNQTPIIVDAQSMCIVPKVDKNFGTFKKTFIKWGLIVPDYNIRVEYNADNVNCGAVTSVTWKLPNDYFQKSQVVTTNDKVKFAIDVEAWKPFPIEAEVTYNSGQKKQLLRIINFDTAPGLLDDQIS